MASGPIRIWLSRIGGILFLLLLAGGVYAGLNWSMLKGRFAAAELRSAASESDRAAAADRLVAIGPQGYVRLAEILRAGDDASRTAAAAAIERFLSKQPENDPRSVLLSGHVLGAFAQADDAGRRSILALIGPILKRTGTSYATYCRDAVAAGLTMADVEARASAVRLALHPDIKLRKELLPLLGDPEPRVRAAALFGAAIAADGAPVLTDEDLFPYLHDPDAGVRKVCYDVLVSRDRTDAEIGLGRRLRHPDPGERLKLLFDLRYDDEVPDVEPWLERLSRDSDPAVRAGAARVALEVTTDRRQGCPLWVARLSETDPDPLVRRVAGYFRKESQVPASGVRPAGGP